MAAVLKKKDINFIRVYYAKPKRKQKHKSKVISILLLAVILLVLIAVYQFFKVRMYMLNAELEQIQMYTENADKVELYQQAQTQESEYAKAQQVSNNLLRVKNSLASYTKFSKADYEEIAACSSSFIKISHIGFDNSASTLTLTATADSVTDVSQYIVRLLATDLFSDVSYKGYTVINNGKYEFTVTCIVKAGANK